LGCFGDGGCVATNNNNLVEKIKMVKSHGSKVKYEHEILGGNFRLDTLQASILSVLLPSLDNWIEKRRQNAERYSDALGGIEELKLPRHIVGHSWNQYTIRTKRRDKLKEWLDSRSIGNAIYYPKALHQQKVFNLDQSLPKAERTCKEVLSLPIYPGLQKKEQDTVISAIKDFF
jgi:dTDP-4-amino-4,6-dideoxygalactose transaminase